MASIVGILTVLRVKREMKSPRKKLREGLVRGHKGGCRIGADMMMVSRGRRQKDGDLLPHSQRMSIRRMLAVLLLCVGALLGEGDGRPLEQPARRSDDNTAQTIVRVVNLDFTSANNITFSLHGDNSFDFSLGPGGCYDVLGPDFTDANAFYVSNPEGYTSINWHAGIFFSPETAYTCCGGATNRWWHMQPTQCPYDKKENTYLCNGTAAAYVPFGAWYQSFSTVQSPASIAVFNAAGSQSPVSWTPSALVPYMLVWVGTKRSSLSLVAKLVNLFL